METLWRFESSSGHHKEALESSRSQRFFGMLAGARFGAMIGWVHRQMLLAKLPCAPQSNASGPFDPCGVFPVNRFTLQIARCNTDCTFDRLVDPFTSWGSKAQPKGLLKERSKERKSARGQERKSTRAQESGAQERKIETESRSLGVKDKPGPSLRSALRMTAPEIP